MIDLEGSWRAVSAIEEWLETAGAGRLTVLTPGSSFLKNVSAEFMRPPLIERMRGRGIEVLAEHDALRRDAAGLVVRSSLTGEIRTLDDIDEVRTITAGHAETGLSAALDAVGVEHVIVGDAFLPRDVLEAMRAVHRAALAYLRSTGAAEARERVPTT